MHPLRITLYVSLTIAFAVSGLLFLVEWMLADRLPARFQTQLHKHIWGAEVRGV